MAARRRSADAKAAVAPPADIGARALARRSPPVYVGTSGFSYAEWRGAFYPEALASKDFLGWYAQCFPTTEINNTFYRIPRPALTAQWRTEVPDDFRFALKLSQRVTHIRRLANADTEMSWFTAAALELGPALGSVLVQLPPNFKKDAPRLDEFLAKHAPRLPLAVEFRHASWFDDETAALLRARGAAFAVVEGEAHDPPQRRAVAVGPFVYVRLRKDAYAEGELRNWAAWMLAQTVPLYCYVKHDVAAPAVARALIAELGAAAAG